MTKERAETLRNYITLSVTGYSSTKNRIVQISLHTTAGTLQHFPPENYLILHVRQVIRAEAKPDQVGGNPKHDEERWQNT